MTRGWWWPFLLAGCTSFSDSTPGDQAQGGSAGQAQGGGGGQQASGTAGAASAEAGGAGGSDAGQAGGGQPGAGGGGQGGSGGVELPGGPRAMWVRDEAEGCLADPDKAQALLDFAASHQVTSLYLDIRNLLPGQGQNLEKFVKLADDQGIAVELLLGDPAPLDKSKTWALNHAEAVEQVKVIKATVGGFAGPKPTALHLDIRPDTVNTWNTNKIDFASAYLDLLDKAKTELGGALPVRVDIEIFYTNINVPRGGKQLTFFEWVAGAADEVVLMAYRDHLEGQAGGGVLDLIADEFADPSLKASLVVGLKTDCLGASNNNLTFCEEGNAQLESVMAGVRKAHEKSPLFRGFAIHHYASYKTLLLPLSGPSGSVPGHRPRAPGSVSGFRLTANVNVNESGWQRQRSAGRRKERSFPIRARARPCTLTCTSAGTRSRSPAPGDRGRVRKNGGRSPEQEGRQTQDHPPRRISGGEPSPEDTPRRGAQVRL